VLKICDIINLAFIEKFYMVVIDMKKKIVVMMLLCTYMFILVGCRQNNVISVDRPNVDRQVMVTPKPIEPTPSPVVTKTEKQKPESTSKPMPKPAPVAPQKQKTTAQTTMNKASSIRGQGKFPTLARANVDIFFVHGFAKTKSVALTFDDGPDAELTPKLLDVLKEQDVKASFFLLGNRIDSAPEVVKRAYSEGHLILSHTYSHPQLDKTSDEDIKKEMQQTEDKIYSLIGKRPALMRPPFGLVNQNVINIMKSMDYKVVAWSLDSLDWQSMNKDKIIERVMNNVNYNDVILTHMDGGKQPTLDAVPELIKQLKAKGYKFETLDTMFQVPAYK
jgi:peptidoglycan-N-acetylglucosamine deacetylase